MKRIIGITFIIFTVTFFSCQNDKVNIPVDDGLAEKSAQITLTEVQLEAAATETEYEVEFYANAEEMLTRWWKVGQAWKWNHKLRYKMDHCPNVKIENGDEEGYPKTITLSYGEGTILNNGKVLSGEIVIEISAPRKSKDYTRLVSYNNFGVDSLTIVGTSEDTEDKEEDTFRNHTSLLTFTKAGEFEITRTAVRNWIWAEGMETIDDQTDDVIYIEGNVLAENGTDSYEKKIVEALVRKKDCRFIVAGIVEIYLNGSSLISTMDYGDGTCDAIATMINSEGETEIDLAKHKMKGKQNKNQNQHGNQNGNG
ncbi:MAG: hypothetical protein HQ522_20075, partial [Bacteroidetes bacterium]|nr:hypothetical protein [Bacteroidota bacterium]